MSQGIFRRIYSKEFKLEAVDLCRQLGMSVGRVAADAWGGGQFALLLEEATGQKRCRRFPGFRVSAWRKPRAGRRTETRAPRGDLGQKRA